MALTALTRKRIGIQEFSPAGNGTIHRLGLAQPAHFTNYTVTRRWVGNISIGYGLYHYRGYVNYTASITVNGITITTSGQLQGPEEMMQSNAQRYANSTNPSNIELVVGNWYDMSGGSVARGQIVTYDETYYALTLSASTTPVGGKQVGNIAIYNADTDELLAGSTSSATASGTRQYSATIETTATSARFKVVATAVVGTTTTSQKNWHAAYFFDGITANGANVADSSITFAQSTATYTFTVNDNTTPFVVNYGSKYAIKVDKAASAKSSTVSYSRKHSTGNYVTTTISPLSLSGSGTLYVESGQTISISATAADGYVFHTNAVTSSEGGYGSINGNGTTSVSGTKTCSAATTFTISGTQFLITPQIATSGQTSWGTPTINGSSSSVVLKPNTTYTLGFTSATSSTLAAVVNYWSISGSNYTTSFTTGSAITSNITAYLYLRQTKWQLNVANGTNSSWGSVYLGDSGTNTSGWYADGTSVKVRFVSAMADTIAPQASLINYNGSTTDCGNTATITTTNASLTATMYLVQTKWQMDLAYGTSGTEDWGAVSFKKHGDSSWVTGTSDKIYVGTGDQIDLKFTPDTSLVSTIHPQIDHWTFLMQTSSPTAASDGSSTATVTLGDVAANFTAYAYLASAWRKVTIQRSDSGDAAWGNFYLGESGTATMAYYPPGTTITMRFVRDTSFDLKERPQVNAIAIGTEGAISGVDGTYAYTYDLPSGVKTDLAISCSVKQTAWPVAVSSGGNGTVTARRIAISSVAVVVSVTTSGTAASTIYLRSGTSDEYLALSPSPAEHYQFSEWTKNNLANYGTGGANVQLASAANATVVASFVRNDFRITGTSDAPTVCDVYMQDTAQSSAYYLKTVTANPVVICKIKAAYADQYKVASFSVGSQDGIEPQYNAAANLYYVEVANRSDVTVTAHVVPTYFNLTVDVEPGNSADFGTVIVSANDQELATGGYSGRLREGSHVSIVFYEKYGGRAVRIQPSSQIAHPVQTDSSIEFDMPSANCSVSLTLGAKEKYSLTVGVVNLAGGEAANIPGTVRVASRTYQNIVIGATGEDGVAKTFQVYKGEEYAIVVSPVSDYLSRRYAFTGWRDGSSAIPGATDTTLNVINDSASALVRYASYNARSNGTITIEYAKKDGETITAISADEAKYLLAIDNTEDKYDATHWLVGTDIEIGYTVNGSAYDEDGDAYKWTPVQVDVALVGDDYVTPNATWDDGVLTQNGSFRMLGNMKVRLVLTQTHVPGYTAMRVGLRLSSTLMGEVSIFSTEMDAYTTNAEGAMALVQKEKKAVIMAAPRPGYAFAGWFTYAEGVWTAVDGAKAVYEIDYVTSPMTKYYAQFVASTVSNVKEWNGNASVAKTCEWQSKVYVGSQFFNLTCCRVYADAYPVTLKVFMSSSPDGIFGDNARTTEVTITNQNARRLPMLRPEKYFAFRVTGYARINHVGIASSMEALK